MGCLPINTMPKPKNKTGTLGITPSMKLYRPPAPPQPPPKIYQSNKIELLIDVVKTLVNKVDVLSENINNLNDEIIELKNQKTNEQKSITDIK